MGINAFIGIQAIRGRLYQDADPCLSGQLILVFPEEDHQCLPARRKERPNNFLL